MKTKKLISAFIAFLISFFATSNTQKTFIGKFWQNTRASAGSMIGKILGLTVGGYVAGSTLPDTITNLTNATKWANTPTAVSTLATSVVGIIMIVAFIYLILREAGMGD